MAPDPAYAPAPRRLVLVVDDDDVLRRMVVTVLEGAGYEVLSAGSADEAMAHVDREPWMDVLVTDLTLPGLNGRELSQRLRVRCPELATIVMSGATELEPSRFAPDSRTGFLDKPFRLGELTALIARLLR